MKMMKMMPLELRAWHIEYKKMFIVEGLDFFSQQLFGLIKSPPYAELIPFYRCIIMQYTGRLDSKNCKIFDGDIVKGIFLSGKEPAPREDFFNTEECIGVVFWANGNASYAINWGDHAAYGIYQTYEVIGNIYQNPELIPKGFEI